MIVDLGSPIPEQTDACIVDSAVPLPRRLRDVGVDIVDVGDEGGVSALARTATQLGVSPGRCVIIADDQAGVRAGRDGGFSLVIGLDRDGGAERLLSSGADTVIADLAEISVRTGDPATSTIADALQVYSQLQELITSRRPAVLLDFDGTLSDIVEDPDSATLVDGAADALRALAANT
ncbi:hypothetical protein OK015_16640 [Mycobacterium sp. Aquia_216]|nr:hypothetical protein OK015_16640 [Mycobacterium sp. Aquia_216]